MSSSRPGSVILRTEDDPPVAKPWWFHSSPLSLDDPLAPLPKAALNEGTWKPFSTPDCTALETGWNKLPDSIKRKEERIPDENGVVDELGLQPDVEEKNAEQVEDVSQDDAKVIVGVERLHHVDLVSQRCLPPTPFHGTRVDINRLGPIYWHPLNSFLDSASVLRSIWFLADTFTPVEQSLSRSLEEGYLSLRAWSNTYADELSSALALGLEAENKLRWKVREDHQGREIFYINDTEAWIVPAVGVVQGLFGSKNVLKGIMDKGKGGVKVIRGYDNATSQEEREIKPIQYTDLIFVIHGIGQKLSERGCPSELCWLMAVESFTFTHAINRFRTHLNNERESELIKDDIRPNYHPCILPINWRSRLSFDFDRPPVSTSRPALSRMSTSTSGILEDNIFTIKDLQPKSIHVVRDLIKDVMLDIPYYLSSHKEKILEAVAAEANRVFEVFCRCNSYFQDNGRVHIIGHSLGSVIAMDVLSGQPTYVDPNSEKVDRLHFGFNTTNLYCLGSPAGFFLMYALFREFTDVRLERVSLVPRAGRRKTKDARRNEVETSHGQFGCLAIDNLYNVYDLTDRTLHPSLISNV